MAFCPVCKCEYKKGIEVCPDCKEVLMESLENLSHTMNEDADIDEMIHLSTAVDDLEKSTSSQEENEPGSASLEKVKVYKNSAELCNDNKSSAYILLTVGILGAITLVLICMDVIPLYSAVTPKVITSVVMGSLFTVFVVMGIVSLKKAKELSEKADSESDLTREILDYFASNLTEYSLDKSIRDEEFEHMTEELKYFKRIEHIRELVTKKFMNLEEEYVTFICDEVYAILYDEDDED